MGDNTLIVWGYVVTSGKSSPKIFKTVGDVLKYYKSKTGVKEVPDDEAQKVFFRLEKENFARAGDFEIRPVFSGYDDPNENSRIWGYCSILSATGEFNLYKTAYTAIIDTLSHAEVEDRSMEITDRVFLELQSFGYATVKNYSIQSITNEEMNIK